MSEYEVRYQHWLRGRRAQRTVRVKAQTKEEAELKFLQGFPENRVKVLSVFPARTRKERD